MRRVLVVQERLPHYRVPFFAGLRERLLDDGVQLELAYGHAPPADDALLPWATPVRHVRLGSGDRAPVWQGAYRLAGRSDLVVVEQASRLVATYALLARQQVHGTPVALWGHGANLKADLPPLARAGEAAKRRWSCAARWWFAYTEGSADRVAALGYPRERITVVQNATRPAWLRGSDARPREPYHCVFVGSLYAEKRLDLLIEAADRVVEREPGFTLTVVGDGPLRDELRQLAAVRPYLRVAGPLYGDALGDELRRASLMLMPGAVGLGVVDAFAAALPLVTTDARTHGPEFEYVTTGVNGLVTPAGDASAYARAVLGLLRDPVGLSAIQAAARRCAERYTVESMVDRFAGGVLAALGGTVAATAAPLTRGPA